MFYCTFHHVSKITKAPYGDANAVKTTRSLFQHNWFSVKILHFKQANGTKDFMSHGKKYAKNAQMVLLCGTEFNRGQWSGICFSVQTCWRTRLVSLTRTGGFQPKKQEVFRQYCLRPSAHIARGNNRNMNTLTAEGQYDSFPDDGGYGDISQVSCLTPPLESWTREWGIIQ